MKWLTLLCLTAIHSASWFGESETSNPPTLYEYYTAGGIHLGLDASTDQFKLNGKHFVLHSGSFHYFRIVPERWAHTLAQYKAAGLNAIQIYVPWNLHEETPGHFDFDSPKLNLTNLLVEAKKSDLFVVARPGPYICAEWELGGHPSWLIRDENMRFRTRYSGYLNRVKLYYNKVLEIFNKHQFSTTGGPVIMLQIENEYMAAYSGRADKVYLNELHDIVTNSGFKQLIFTSDPIAPSYPIKGVFPKNDVLETLNGNHGLGKKLLELKKRQPKPGYVSEFWPGWFDKWGEHHHTYSLKDFENEVSDVFFTANSSVNYYMFRGGTNFAFTNGDRIVTSYDYNAPLSESSNYTDKYHKTRVLYLKLVESGRFPKLALPDVPKAKIGHAFGTLNIAQYLSLESLLSHVEHKFTNQPRPVPMEMLNYTDEKTFGQRFGFILYRVETNKAISHYEITGPIADRGVFLVNQKATAVIEENQKSFNHKFTNQNVATGVHRYDVLVENMGRAISGGVSQRKGIQHDIKIDNKTWQNFTIYSLDFEEPWVRSLDKLSEWQKYSSANKPQAPALYRTELNLSTYDPDLDTYVQLKGWNKGNVFVNGFNLGRYWKKGPQQTLYLPGTVLRKGVNTIDVFEQHEPGESVQLIDYPILG